MSTMTHESDPKDFTVEEVQDYLDATLDPSEVGRVLGLERAGKARKSLLGWPLPQSPARPPPAFRPLRYRQLWPEL